MLRFARSVFPAFLLLLAACSSSSSASPGGASTTCSTNADCASGLECIPFGAYTDGGCTQVQRACSTPCTSDADCTSLGSKYKCFTGCPGSPMFCGATP